MTLRTCLLTLIATLCGLTAALADPAPPANEARARALLLAGNERFASDDFVRAVEHYKAALALWDQPMIRFNLAVALIELDRSREAYEHLQAALRAPDVIGERLAEARNYARLVRARLSTVRVDCPHGAECEIDGVRVKAGDEPLVLEPGAHTLAARQRGYADMNETLVLDAGAHRDVTVRLSRPRARMVRRWASYKPWSVVGLGVLAAAGGATVFALGRNAVAGAQDELAVRCLTGCAGGFPPDLQERADDGHRLQRLGGGVAIGGAALLAAGAVLVLLNQPYVEVARVAATRPPRSRRFDVVVAPTADGAVAALGGRW